MTRVGILGVGVHLPSEIRTNAWWPAETVERWTQVRKAAPPPPAPKTEGTARVLRAMREEAGDPFQGAVERRVLAADRTSTDMEAEAAEDALRRAGIDRGAIDLLLTHTQVPELLVNNSACVLHHRLGLGARCLPLQLEATAYSFLAQLEYAELAIAAGRATYALLVQSCAMSRLIDRDDLYSPVFGDGATAVVVGPVADPRGVLHGVHRSATEHPHMLVAGTKDGAWYDGKSVLHSRDLPGARDVFLAIADQAKEVCDAVIEGAHVRREEIRFFASHQGTPWVRKVAQELAGLSHARSIDAFPYTGTLFASNIPLILRSAEDEGLVSPDDLVVLFGGGTGVVYGATLVRWGR
ncbi:MAG TPA: 3-oxoacyl-[acyl-carrier-protein] synthase III C-terminal domain-containing protein [Kofleriaceae bacterium]|nr:3-oxoacyl-[acyl-carrier-protein] synthase III C-terminal domain-containing protein [Kofleriaceae bacterium]